MSLRDAHGWRSDTENISKFGGVPPDAALVVGNARYDLLRVGGGCGRWKDRVWMGDAKL